jgi:hypothetical protein
MSHYSVVRSKITRPSCIKKALVKMGFKAHMIEDFGKEKENLRGYQGDKRKQQANIRIKGSGWSGQNYVGGCSNDLGFELLEDGTYGFHVSEYDSGRYNKAWIDKFTRAYSREVVGEICQEQNFFIAEESEEDGELVMKLQSPF